MLANTLQLSESVSLSRLDARKTAEERVRAERYPLSRWYLRPAAGWLARRLAATPVRPWHLTVLGLLAAALAVASLLVVPAMPAIAAGLVLLNWFFDRTDGQLARWQQSVSAFGAWLDANVDELVDLAVHAAVAYAATQQWAAPWPWLAFGAFLMGKYLLMYGMFVEESTSTPILQVNELEQAKGDRRWLRRLYHLPANADVRVHLVVLALLTGWLGAELLFVAAYYNLRWMMRYYLVARRALSMEARQ